MTVTKDNTSIKKCLNGMERSEYKLNMSNYIRSRVDKQELLRMPRTFSDVNEEPENAEKYAITTN